MSAALRKQVFADLDAALAQRFGSEVPAAVRSHSDEWRALREQLKTLREEKQLRARDFAKQREVRLRWAVTSDRLPCHDDRELASEQLRALWRKKSACEDQGAAIIMVPK